MSSWDGIPAQVITLLSSRNTRKHWLVANASGITEREVVKYYLLQVLLVLLVLLVEVYLAVRCSSSSGGVEKGCDNTTVTVVVTVLLVQYLTCYLIVIEVYFDNFELTNPLRNVVQPVIG